MYPAKKWFIGTQFIWETQVEILDRSQFCHPIGGLLEGLTRFTFTTLPAIDLVMKP
jgi:hypothetical protein